MPPLRLLVVATPEAAARVVTTVRKSAPVDASLAPTAAALSEALATGGWDGVLVVPGGSVADGGVARAMHDQSVPVIVVGPSVPDTLASCATLALVWEGLEALPTLLASLGTPAAFVGRANAFFADDARQRDALPEALATASRRTARHPQARPLALPAHTATASAAPAPPPPAPAGGDEAQDAAPDPTPSDLGADALAQHLPIGVYRSTPDGRILYANPALATLLGCSSVEGLAAIDVRSDLGYPRDAFREEIERTGHVRNLIVTWTDRTGRTVHTRENARAVTDDDGQLLHYEGTMEDVTAEVSAREADRVRVRQHEAVASFAEAAETASQLPHLQTAAVEAVRYAIEADWAVFVEHTRDADGQGHNRCAVWTDAFPSEAAEMLDADPVFQSLPVLPQTVLLRDVASRPDGWLPPSLMDVLQSQGYRSVGVFPLLRAGLPLGAFVVGFRAPHTYTPSEQQAAEALAWHLAGHLARHHAERDLSDSEASLRFIAEHTGLVLYRLRYAPDGLVFDYLSPSVEALLGYTADEIEAAGGITAFIETREVISGDGLLDGPLAGVCDQHYRALYRFTDKGGRGLWVENNAYVWCEGDEAVGLVGVFQDVTERRREEEAQADAAQQLLARQAALVDLARHHHEGTEALLHRVGERACEASGADGASVWLAEGAWMTCQACVAPMGSREPAPTSVPIETFDAALERFRGRRALVVDDAADGEALRELGFGAYHDAFAPCALLAAPVRRGGEAIGLVVLHRTDGPHAWSEGETDFAAALADAVALALEHAERARAETALRRSEARYRALSDLTTDYAFALHRRPSGESLVAWATDGFERTTGHPVDDLFDDEGLAALVPPSTLAEARRALAPETADGTAREFQIRTSNGTSRWVSHRARVAETAADGTVLEYHTGQDVTQHKQHEAEMIAAREAAEAGREAAEEMARLKSAFLANMSHEIRTPLTSIFGYADLLGGELSGQQLEYVQLIERGGRRLFDTLNSVLDLARLEADGVRPTLEPVRVGQEVGQVARALAPLAAEKGIELVVDADDRTEARLDASCLARIVSNLIGNAIKFTETGGVRVTVDSGDGEVRVRVADTGIGIAEKFLPHLFDEFRQEEIGDARSHEGSGLGLSITSRLVGLLGGEITVTSRRPGGSMFTVTFPSLPAPSQDGAESPLGHSADDAAPVASDAAPLDTLEAAPDIAAYAPSGDGLSVPLPEGSPLSDAVPQTDPAALAFDLSFLTRPAPASLPASALSLVETAPTAMHDPRFGSTPTQAPTGSEPTHGPIAPNAPLPDASPAPLVPAFAASFVTSLSDASSPAPFSPATAEPAAAAWPTGSPDAPQPQTPPADAPADVMARHEPVMLVRPAREPEPRPEIDPDDDRPSILVVEDNADTRLLLERILRAQYRVTAVADARSALVEMNRQQFEGFVLDINLGGKETGADVLRIARTLEGYADVYAIALTAYALPGDRERLLENGFNEYISKPFTRQSLLDALATGVRPS